MVKGITRGLTLFGSAMALSLGVLATPVQAQTINLSYNGAPDLDKNAVHVFASTLKRFRAMDPSQVALYEAFGASGTPIPWTETYMALRTGVADGQMNPPMYIILGSLYEVQKYLTLANIQYSDQFLVANGQLLDSLSDENREALLSAVHEANQMARITNQAKVGERIAYLQEQGMEITNTSEVDLEALRAQGQPAYLDWLTGEQGIDQRWVDMALEDAGMTKLAN